MPTIHATQIGLSDGSIVDLVTPGPGNVVCVVALKVDVPEMEAPAFAAFVLGSAGESFTPPFYEDVDLRPDCGFVYFRTKPGEALTASAQGLDGEVIDGLVWWYEERP